MGVQRVWQKAFSKSMANEERRRRSVINWPLHAERVEGVFKELQAAALADGVRLHVHNDSLSIPKIYSAFGPRVGKFPLGESTVCIAFGGRLTGVGVLEITEDGDQRQENDYEEGAQLAVHHSPASGLVQVFMKSPVSGRTTKKAKRDILIAHTYNTDRVTREWVEGLVAKFLVFNRAESTLENAGLLDRLRVRWWRFMDVRNRRGHMEQLQHIMTPWELILIGVAAAPAIWLLGQVLDLLTPFWNLLNPFNLQ